MRIRLDLLIRVSVNAAGEMSTGDMSLVEGDNIDYKSLRTVTGQTANFPELAKDCVCFGNGKGGQIVIGVEDGEVHPPKGQSIPPDLLDRVLKRIAELTVNVTVLPELRVEGNGGECLVLVVQRAIGVASTSDGRYYLRVGDACRSVVGDEVLRLVNERPSVSWEAMTSLNVSRHNADETARTRLIDAIRQSERVHIFVKEKSDSELLDHYGLVNDESLTNLGILLVGSVSDRARLGTAPIVQAIRYDEQEKKIGKFVWDDYSLSPIELVEAVRRDVPDFDESYKLPHGLFRSNIAAYDESVVRELLVNAIVHRPYTQRGDIFLSLYPDRLEIANVG